MRIALTAQQMSLLRIPVSPWHMNPGIGVVDESRKLVSGVSSAVGAAVESGVSMSGAVLPVSISMGGKGGKGIALRGGFQNYRA